MSRRRSQQQQQQQHESGLLSLFTEHFLLPQQWVEGSTFHAKPDKSCTTFSTHICQPSCNGVDDYGDCSPSKWLIFGRRCSLPCVLIFLARFFAHVWNGRLNYTILLSLSHANTPKEFFKNVDIGSSSHHTHIKRPLALLLHFIAKFLVLYVICTTWAGKRNDTRPEHIFTGIINLHKPPDGALTKLLVRSHAS